MKCPNIIQNQVFKTTVFSHETEPKYVNCDIFNLDSFLSVIASVKSNKTGNVKNKYNIVINKVLWLVNYQYKQ